MTQAIDAAARYGAEELDYSICTLVTRWDEYRAMQDSFRAKGFREPACEFLYLDNAAGNRFDAYSGLNLFLSTARGRVVVLCHQDVRLVDDGRAELDAIIAAMDRDHPQWGVLGNAGGTPAGTLCIRITDPHGADTRRGAFPAAATALDENFLAVRRSANLALSADVGGYHLYGADLCLMADLLGHSAHVVDFHLHHLSPGNADASFAAARRCIIAKYQRALAPRWVTTTCTAFVAGGGALSTLAGTRWGAKLLRSLRKRYRGKRP
ncbi:MAG: hypothetical protein NVV74_04665 [Magnetospirillum sp.]|nr:hypothetical protein [Magnetospirillum sp.]